MQDSSTAEHEKSSNNLVSKNKTLFETTNQYQQQYLCRFSSGVDLHHFKTSKNQRPTKTKQDKNNIFSNNPTLGLKYFLQYYSRKINIYGGLGLVKSFSGFCSKRRVNCMNSSLNSRICNSNNYIYIYITYRRPTVYINKKNKKTSTFTMRYKPRTPPSTQTSSIKSILLTKSQICLLSHVN